MSRTLFIPEIGDAVVLAEDWTFSLYIEGRNSSLWSALPFPKLQNNEWWISDYNKMEPTRKAELEAAGITFNRTVTRTTSWGDQVHHTAFAKVTLPKGTILTVDRIYIRKGISEYSSVTFLVRETSIPHKGKIRFWAKLSDVNTMVIEDAPLPALPKKPSKPKRRYTVWVKYTDAQIKANPYIARNVQAYDLQVAQSDPWARRSFGPMWMSDPRYYGWTTETVRTESDLVEALKKKHGSQLKAIIDGGHRIYEAP